MININLRDKPEFLSEKNPLGKVPVIEYDVDGKLMNESLDIADFLDDTFPGPKLHASSSDDKQTREKERELLNELIDKLRSVNYIRSKDKEKATLWIELDTKLKVVDAFFTNEYLAGN